MFVNHLYLSTFLLFCLLPFLFVRLINNSGHLSFCLLHLLKIFFLVCFTKILSFDKIECVIICLLLFVSYLGSSL